MSGNLVTKLVQAAAIHPSRIQVQNTDFSATFGGKSQLCTVVVLACRVDGGKQGTVLGSRRTTKIVNRER
jgi:hypothetical protein